MIIEQVNQGDDEANGEPGEEIRKKCPPGHTVKRYCQAVIFVQLLLGLFISIQAKGQQKRQGNERRPNGLWVPEADQKRSDLGAVDDQD